MIPVELNLKIDIANVAIIIRDQDEYLRNISPENSLLISRHYYIVSNGSPNFGIYIYLRGYDRSLDMHPLYSESANLNFESHLRFYNIIRRINSMNHLAVYPPFQLGVDNVVLRWAIRRERCTNQ